MQSATGVLTALHLAPPPRRIRFRSIGLMLEVWIWRSLVLALSAVPLFLWWLILHSPIIQTFGRNQTAVLESVRQWRSKGGSWDGRSYDVTYSFDTGGGQREVEYGHLETAGGPPPKPGDPIAIKVLYLWPRYRAEFAGYNLPMAGPCCFSVFATMLTLVWLIGSVVVWYSTLRERRIMRRGVGVMGIVKQKVEKPLTEWIIWYTFPAADGKTWGNKAVVSQQMYEQFAQGQEVVVVYLRDRPLKSVLYEASKYRAG